MIKRPSVVYAAAAVAVMIVLLITVCAPLQSSLGMAGLAITEIIVLAVAVGGAFAVSRITGEPLKSFFPLKAVPGRYIVGAFVVYFGAYFVMYAAAAVTQLLFPAAVEEAQALIEFTSSVPVILGVLITAVMPAICEEALHRGLVLRCIKGSAEKLFGNDGVILRSVFVTAVGGLLFGLFHLDPYRFLTTAILGGAFSYICYKSGSMLPGVMLHFINNLMSVSAMYSQPAQYAAAQEAAAIDDEMLNGIMAQAEEIASDPRAVIGTALIMLGWGVLFLRLGQKLMNPRRTVIVISPYAGMYGETGAVGYQTQTPDGGQVTPSAGKKSAPRWLKTLAIALTVIALMTIGANLVTSVITDGSFTFSIPAGGTDPV